MTLLVLCWEFFKTGLFAVGGGLATIPFLTAMSDAHPGWFTHRMLADMIAVSESTPGAIGINMATYVGYTVSGLPGAVLATFFLTLPSLIIITVIAGLLEKFMSNKFVARAFSGMRPAVVGLIAAAAYSVFKIAFTFDGAVFDFSAPFEYFNLAAIIMFVVLFVLTQLKPTRNIHPVFYIAAAAAVGIFVF